MLERPWTTGQLRRLSLHLRDGVVGHGDRPDYGEVMSWYNDLAAEVQSRVAGLDWPPLLQERQFEVTSRPKTIDTLRQKLQRDPSTPLPSVQDIAGVRFEAEMSLDEQDAVVNAICGVFNHDPAVAVRDMRSNHHSGYRAVHIWLRLPARVEVQVRTHLQGEWANMYESAADALGRDIRYGHMPQHEPQRSIVVALQELSTERIAHVEALRNEMGRLDIEVDDLTRSGAVRLPAEHARRMAKLRERTRRDEATLRDEIVRLRSLFDELREKGS